MSEPPSTQRVNPFEFDPEIMRRIGHRGVDRVVERMLGAEQVPPVDWNQGSAGCRPTCAIPMPRATCSTTVTWARR
jgi:hypothetical protein